MLGTLILLYALNANNVIPDWCFIAAWVLFAMRFIVIAVEHFTKPKW